MLRTANLKSALVLGFSSLAILTGSLEAAGQTLCVQNDQGENLSDSIVEVFLDDSRVRRAVFHSGTSHCVSIASVTGVERNSAIVELGEMEVFPNPAGASFQLRLELPSTQGTHLELTDVLGRRVFSSMLPAGGGVGARVHTGSLSAGTYFVRATSGELSFVRPVSLLGGGAGPPGVEVFGTPSINPAHKTASRSVSVRVTRLGYEQTLVDLPEDGSDVDVVLPHAPVVRVFGVEMSDHRQPLRGGELRVEELRSGLTKTVPFGDGLVELEAESDSLRLTYWKAQGDTTWTSGRSSVREGPPGLYGALLTASYSEVYGGPLRETAPEMTLFAMHDAFPWYNYADGHFSFVGHSYVDFFRLQDHPPDLAHLSIDWSNPAYRRGLPSGTPPQVRNWEYRIPDATCWDGTVSQPDPAVVDSIGSFFDDAREIQGRTRLDIRFTRAKREDDYVTHIEAATCGWGSPSWEFWWFPETGEIKRTNLNYFRLESDDGLKRRAFLNGLSNFFARADHSLNGNTWPRVTEAPDPPAITEWAKRWFAVSVAFGPIPWGSAYSNDPPRGVFHSIFWGK